MQLRKLAVGGCVFVLTGCGLLAPKPPLPRAGTIESASSAVGVEDLNAIVERAEIFYLPTDRIGRASGAGRRMVDALRRSGVPVAIGWGVLALDQQPLLEHSQGLADQELVSRVAFVSTEESQRCRTLLRESHELGLRSAALRCDSAPSHDYACMADQIVRQFGALSNGKLLVVIERRDVEAARGVPYYVAQRLSVRQLVLDSATAPAERVRLLTDRADFRRHGLLQIVDCAPRAGSDRL